MRESVRIEWGTKWDLGKVDKERERYIERMSECVRVSRVGNQIGFRQGRERERYRENE